MFSLVEKNAGPVKALVASAHRVAHVLELLEEVFADILRYVVSLLHLVFFAALAALLRIKRYLVQRLHHVLNLVDLVISFRQLFLVLEVDCRNFLSLYDVFLLRFASEFAAEQLATSELEPRPPPAPLNQVFRVIFAQSEAKERLRREQLCRVPSFLLDRSDMDVVQISENLCVQHVLGGTVLLIQNFQVFLRQH